MKNSREQESHTLNYYSSTYGYYREIQVGQELGSGAYGRVDLLSDPEFVVKTMTTNGHYSNYMLAYQELVALERLGRLDGYIRDEDTVQAVMPRIDGVTLDTWLYTDGNKQEDIQDQIVASMQELRYQHGIVDSDRHERNMIVDASNRVHQIDFGLSTLTHQSFIERCFSFYEQCALLFAVLAYATYTAQTPIIMLNLGLLLVQACNVFLHWRAFNIFPSLRAMRWPNNERLMSTMITLCIVLSWVIQAALFACVVYFGLGMLQAMLYSLAPVLASSSITAAVTQLVTSPQLLVALYTLVIRAMPIVTQAWSFIASTVFAFLPRSAWLLYMDFRFDYIYRPIRFFTQSTELKGHDERDTTLKTEWLIQNGTLPAQSFACN